MHQLTVAHSRWPIQLQTCAAELNVYRELRYHFRQYLTFFGSLHRIFEGHKKWDVISKVSDPSFTNLVQRSDNDEEPMLIE